MNISKEFIATIKHQFANIDPKPIAGLSTHHDERSIATILAFKFPGKYPLYKASFFDKLVRKLNIKKAPAKERYIQYIGLVQDFIEFYLIKETALISKVKEELAKDGKPFYADDNLMLLAQDILYRVLDYTPSFAEVAHEFKEAMKGMKALLNKYSEEIPAVEYFCNMFLDNAGTTLDEQAKSLDWIDQANQQNLR